MGRLARVVAFSAFAVASSAAFGLPADNFNDNVRGPEWGLLPQPPDDPNLSLSETNQRLEVNAANPVSAGADALYASNGPSGFRLSTAGNFSIVIDYHFTSFASSIDGSAFALDFGVGRDEAGTDSAAVAFGYADFGPAVASSMTVGHRTGNVQSPAFDSTNLLAPNTGTFLISYAAAGDDLSLGLDGLAPAFTLNDTVRGVWHATDLLVSFGARGNGFTTTSSGDAFLDNFVVRTGTVVPEPASLGVFALGMVGLVGRRRGRAAGL